MMANPTLQLLAKFHKNLIDRSHVLRPNPSESDYILGSVLILFDSPNNNGYSFYSYLSSKTSSFLNSIVLQGIKWIISRSRIFLTYSPMPYDDKPFFYFRPIFDTNPL